MTKFCANCKFYEAPKVSIVPSGFCVNPKLGVNVVTGRLAKTDANSCRSNLYNFCRTEGNWFEPLNSIVSKQNKKKWWMIWIDES